MQYIKYVNSSIMAFLNTLQSEILQSMALSFIDHLQLVYFGVEEDDIGKQFLESNNSLIDHPECRLI